MNNADLLVETAVVHGQLSTGIPPAIVAVRSSLGGRGVAVLAGKSRVNPKLGKFKSPNWTKKEDIFLERSLGILSEEAIAEMLGRSVIAVHLRWKRDLRLPAPSKNPEIMTCNQIANGLAIDSHAALKLIQRDILPGYLLPGKDVTYVVNRIALLRFIVNPMNWIYFKPERIGTRPTGRRGKVFDVAFWAYAKRLALKRKALWEDEWWRIGKVARYHRISCNAVNKAVRVGRLKATDWGNWWVLKSQAKDPSLQLQTWTGKGGKGQPRLQVSLRAEAFMVLAEAVGLMHSEIAVLMKWKEKRVCYFLHLMRKRGRIKQIIKENNLKVFYDRKTGKTFASWKMHRDRFPHLAKLMESIDCSLPMTRSERKYINRVKRKTEYKKHHELLSYNKSDMQVESIMEELEWLKDKFKRAGRKRNGRIQSIERCPADSRHKRE